MTTDRQNPIPYKLPNAPTGYSVEFFNQLNRQVERALNKLEQPELIKGGGIMLSLKTLPTYGYGLRPGTVYRDISILKIVLDGDSFLSTISTISVGLGTITVTTT